MDYRIDNLWLDIHNGYALMQMQCHDDTNTQVAVMNYNVKKDNEQFRSYITNIDFAEDFMPDVCKLMFHRLAEEVGPDFDFVSDALSKEQKMVIETIAYPAVDVHAEDILESVADIRANLRKLPKNIEDLSESQLFKVEDALSALDRFQQDFAKIDTLYSFHVLPVNPKMTKNALTSAKDSFEHLAKLRASNQPCVVDTVHPEHGKPLTFFSQENMAKIFKTLSAPYKMLNAQIKKVQVTRNIDFAR